MAQNQLRFIVRLFLTVCASILLNVGCGSDETGGAGAPPGVGPCDVVEECDDENECTLDQCTENMCTHIAQMGKECDDGNQCTTGSSCASDGSCIGGSPVLVALDPCQICNCDPEKGIECTSFPEGSSCDDGDCCTNDDICFGCNPLVGDCPNSGLMCQGVAKECADENACTVDSCDCGGGTAKCLFEPKNNGSACEFSENDCTLGDKCVDGICVPGEQAVLDDGNPCTQDLCIKGDIVHTEVLEGQCDDANECTIGDYCYLGTCVGAANVECDLPDTCAGSVSCVQGDGCVVDWLPVGAACDDGDPCSTGSICDADHECAASNQDGCDDNLFCTFDYCDADTGECQHTVIEGPCEDGNQCTINDTCEADGICRGTPMSCDIESNPCMQAACNPATGLCDMPLPDGLSCADDNPCDGAELCANGVCTPGISINCSGVANPCIQPVCNPESGTCDLLHEDGEPCPDGNLCDGVETCLSGICMSGPPVDCSDAGPCLEGWCNAETGLCDIPVEDGTFCLDDDLCDGDEQCHDGVCQKDEPVDCSWVTDVCLENVCNAFTGACDFPRPDGTLCADDVLCDGIEACSGGVCIDTEPVDCSAPAPCMTPSCNEVSGLCDIPLPNGTICEDGDMCSTAETCMLGECVNGSPVDCGDGIDCTTDLCHADYGCHHEGNNALCVDGDSCTYDECVLGVGCQNLPGEEIYTAPLDLFLLQDMSGSFDDDINTMKQLTPALINAIVTGGYVNPRFGMGTFIDKPIAPFGNASDYVYQLDLPLTADGSALTAVVNGLDASGGKDGPEAQLEALLQTAVRMNEIGFRPDALRVVVLCTDAGYHEAGHGASAGIFVPNNLDMILDGSPPGTGEDYPSIADVRLKLDAANILPIFAVTSSQVATYSNVVTQLGFGAVVTLSSNSSNLITAIIDGLSILSCPGVCCSQNPTPSCQDPNISSNVCEINAWCCTGSWDNACVDYATDLELCP